MTRQRAIRVGSSMIVIALLVILAGAIWPATERLIADGVLVALPCLLAIVGCAFAIVGVIRAHGSDGWLLSVRALLAVSALSGLALVFAWGDAGFLSQIPDTLAGLNGAYQPGSSAGLSALILGGFGVLGGLVVGCVLAGLLRLARRSS